MRKSQLQYAGLSNNRLSQKSAYCYKNIGFTHRIKKYRKKAAINAPLLLLCYVLYITNPTLLSLIPFLKVEIAGIPNFALVDQILSPPQPDVANASPTLAVKAVFLSLFA